MDSICNYFSTLTSKQKVIGCFSLVAVALGGIFLILAAAKLLPNGVNAISEMGHAGYVGGIFLCTCAVSVLFIGLIALKKTTSSSQIQNNSFSQPSLQPISKGNHSVPTSSTVTDSESVSRRDKYESNNGDRSVMTHPTVTDSAPVSRRDKYESNNADRSVMTHPTVTDSGPVSRRYKYESNNGDRSVMTPPTDSRPVSDVQSSKKMELVWIGFKPYWKEEPVSTIHLPFNVKFLIDPIMTVRDLLNEYLRKIKKMSSDPKDSDLDPNNILVFYKDDPTPLDPSRKLETIEAILEPPDPEKEFKMTHFVLRFLGTKSN